MSPCTRSRPIALDAALEDAVGDATTRKFVVKNTFLTLTGSNEEDAKLLHSGLKTAPASLQRPGCLKNTWNEEFRCNQLWKKHAEVEGELLSPTTESTQPSTPPAEGTLEMPEPDSGDGSCLWPATPASPLKTRVKISLSELTASDGDEEAVQPQWMPMIMMAPQQHAYGEAGMCAVDGCSWFEEVTPQMMMPCMPPATTMPAESTAGEFWPNGMMSMPPPQSPRLPLGLLLARDVKVDAPPKSPAGPVPASDN